MVFLLCLLSHSHAVAQFDYLGLKGHTAYELRLHQSRLYAATDQGILYHDLLSTDTVWVPVGLQGKVVNTILLITPDTMLAGVRTALTNDTTSLFRTTDGGASWHPFQNGFGGDTEFKEVFSLERLNVQPDRMFATGYSVIARSTDRGLWWEEAFGSWGSAGLATQFLEADGNSIWSGGEGGSFTPLLFRSTDAGDTWHAIPVSIGGGGENACYAVAVDRTNPDVVYVGTEGSIIKSVDAGQNWQPVLAPPEYPYFFGLEISPTDPTVIYAAGAPNTTEPHNLKLYISYDEGTHWGSVAYDDLTQGGVGDLIVERSFSTDVVYIATRTRDTTSSEGVYVFRNDLTAYTEQKAVVPQEFFLCQNHPNPFNPSTTIRYRLPARSHVTLDVIDMLGRVVATVVDALEPAGYKSVRFAAQGLPSGVYLCRLRAGGFVSTRKLLLLR